MTTIIDNYNQQLTSISFRNKNTPSLMATKIIKNLEKLFVFAPNEMQQAAFEGAKQNEKVKDNLDN